MVRTLIISNYAPLFATGYNHTKSGMLLLWTMNEDSMSISSACAKRVRFELFMLNYQLTYPNSFLSGTYGGHVELSAFAHMTRRNVKVIQPGLVYVIEWHAGMSPEDMPPAPSLTSLGLPEVDPSAALVNERDRRKAKRESKRLDKVGVPPATSDLNEESSTTLPTGPVYVA